MSSHYTETEIKLYVPDLQAILARLQSIGAVLTVPRIYERNVRYENTAQTLTADGIVLRLRQDNRVRLTYKEDSSTQNSHNGILTRFEAEVEVSDFDAMETILGKLGYLPYMIYEKYRTSYQLDGAEIVLDELPYGNFVEIEGQEMVIKNLLTSLNLQDAPRFGGSYTSLFDRVRHHLNLSFTDLTFAHFKGISVPESAFAPDTLSSKLD